MVERAPLLSPDELAEKYKEFIRFYLDEGGEPIYSNALAQMIEDQRRSLEVNWVHLYNFNPEFREIAEDIIVHPTFHLEAASRALKELVSELLGDLV
ncbi:MAG: hypothetical protein QI199_00325, partial [Candidatus Korarchaeota archaeon]|nr:hypothetical protein [Candidatus Korarchaeota archaeon]